MADRDLKPTHTLEAGIVPLFGKVTLGAAGAIASQDCKGFTVSKTGSEVGRYTITFADKWRALRAASVTLEGAADAAWGAAGAISFLRGVDVASGKVAYVQFATAIASPADAELPTGTIIYLRFDLKNSSAW